MTARVYKHLNNQGLYVFSLEGNFSSEKEVKLPITASCGASKY